MHNFKKLLGFCLFTFFSISHIYSESYFIKVLPEVHIESLFKKVELRVNEVNSGYALNYSKAFVKLTEKGLDRVYVIELPDQMDDSAVASISLIEGVEYIERVPQYQLFYSPNDYSSSLQWYLNTIKATDAWDIERGGKEIVIGLVDDGMDTLHPDLQPVLWHNVDEIRGNGIDDDKNGFIDDYIGWDVADNDNNPSVLVTDGLDHGTHCGGIAAASTDNSNGIASLAFNVKIMPIKTGRIGQPGLYNTYQGVEYAIINGANVISMSWGAGLWSYSFTIQTLFDVAYARNIVCVAAAGNDYDSIKNYPADYNHVISVGATDINDEKTAFSCYGSWVDVMAPGENIYSTLPGNSYGAMDGTSMACPLVSGLCALMLSKNPTLSVDAIEACLKSSCDNINAQNSSYIGQIGAGRINAFKALRCIKPLDADFTSSKTFVCVGDTVRFFDRSTPSATSRTWSFPGGTPAISTAQNPIVRYNTTGTYNVRMIASKGSYLDTVEYTNYITVGKPKVTFSGVQFISLGEFGTIKADLTGNPPWTLIYTDGKKNDTVSNIIKTPYYILKVPDTTVVYKPVAMISNGCSGDVKDSTIINVNLSSSKFCDSAYRFHLSFGGNNDDQALDMVTKDSFIYIAGKTNTNGAGNYDAVVAKVGLSGKVYWYRTLGGSGEDGYLSIDIDNKENVFCGGYSLSNVNYRAAMMVKYDKNGNLKWKKYYNGVEREYLYDVMVSKNQKHVYFTGHSISDSYGGEDHCIYKLDTSGSVEWVKRYGSASNERPYGITEDDSLQIYTLGSCFPGTYQKASIVKVDKDGTMLYSKTFTTSASNDNLYYSAAEVWDKRFLYAVGMATAASSSTRRLYISKLKLNGTVVWSKEITHGTMGSLPKIRIMDNKLVVFNVSSVSSRSYGVIMTLDSNANILSAKQVGNTSMNMYFSDFDINPDNSISYAGYQSGSNNQYMIGKTNCKMDNQCLFTAVTPNTSNHTLTQSNYFLSSKNFTSVVTPNHSNNSYSHSSTFDCKSTVTKMAEKCRLNADFRITRACTGKDVIFNDMSTDTNGYNIDNYFWEFGDGPRLSNFASITHKYKVSGIYNVRLIVTSSSSNKLTCIDTVYKTYESSDSLFIGLTPNDTSICIGDSLSFAFPKIDCGIGPYKYIWSPAIGISDSSSGQPFFSPRVSTTYKLTIKDVNGAMSSDTVRVVVNKTCCISKARFSMHKPEICIGDSVRFINESSYDNGTEYFEWKFTGANISSYVGKNPPVVKFTKGQPNSVSLFLSDICSNDTAKMDIYMVKPAIANAGPDQNICRLDTIKIGAPAMGRNVYQWTPTTGINQATKANPNLIIDQASQYFLKVTDENGCISRDTVNIGFGNDKILIHNDTSFCEGDSVKLEIPGTGTYNWSNGKTNKSIYVKQTGNYWGERLTSCIARDTVFVQMRLNPVFNLGEDTFFCKGDSIMLQAPISGTYLWSNGSVNNFIQISDAGEYRLRITSNVCSSNDTIQVLERQNPIFSLGANRKLCYDSIVLSPNPLVPNQNYYWSTGETTSRIMVKTIGQYSLLIENSFGCEFSDTVLVSDGRKPDFNLNSPIYKCENINILLELPIVAGQTYSWYDQSSSNKKLFATPGKYWVKAQTECGDSIINFEVIDSSCKCELWIPNAISPNGDGKNDAFSVVARCNLIDYSLKIFNRWGEIVFESNNMNEHWDGTYKGETVILGVYFYSLEFRKDLPAYKEYQFHRGSINVME